MRKQRKKSSVAPSRLLKKLIKQFLQIMKTFVIFTVSIISFISSSAGLKCYHCDDIYTDGTTGCSSNDAVVEVCKKRVHSAKNPGKWFCVTVTINSGAAPDPRSHQYKTCGDEERCTQKGCSYRRHKRCEEAGTYELAKSYGNFTVSCCEGDLCNTYSSAQACRNNLLYCGLFFSLFLLLSEWFTV